MRLRVLPLLLGLVGSGLVSAASGEVGSGPPQTGGPVVLVYAKAVSNRPAAMEWIWRARADGSSSKRLLRGEAPAVSLDGRTIAFLRSRLVKRQGSWVSRQTLWLTRSDGSNPRAIMWTTRGFGPVVWSPDSHDLLVGTRNGLRVVDRVQNRVSLLAGTEQTSTSGIETATFSPDGRLIAYDRDDATGSDIFVIAVSGGTPQQLTHDHQSFGPLWGPSRIAYLHGGDIWLMNGDGTENSRLTSTRAAFYPAAWSRDGRRLLGANPATHNGRLWAIDVPTGRARPLTGWVGDLFPQGLSRDGQFVYAAVGCGGTVSPFGRLETIPFSGGRPRVIIRGPCRGSWSA